jgi:hypothetical protein
VIPCLRNANELSKLLIASLENRLSFSRALSNLGFGKPPGGKVYTLHWFVGRRTRTEEFTSADDLPADGSIMAVLPETQLQSQNSGLIPA